MSNFIPQGKCACGQTAYILRSYLLSPDDQTQPVPLCDECNRSEMNQMLRSTERIVRIKTGKTISGETIEDVEEAKEIILRRDDE